MPIRIVVIAEAAADQRLACGLIDRKILHHAPEWWDADQIEYERVWTGLRPGTKFTRWKDICGLPEETFGLRRIRSIGFHDRDEQRFDYESTRKVLLICPLLDPQPDGILLVRDLDRSAFQRRASIERARADFASAKIEVVLALPKAKREAWVLNGFQCHTPAENTRLAELRQQLAFDPCTQAERLDAMAHGEAKDAKRILTKLTGGKVEREERCWAETEWAVLRERGQHTGLHAFLQEVQTKLVPLITGEHRR